MERKEMIMFATAYHGRVFSDEQIDAMTDRQLISLMHPDDRPRKKKSKGEDDDI